jgi:pheromone shutdown protein TraB
MKAFTTLAFAILVSVGAIVAGSACFAATVGTSAQWIGVLISSLATGLSGMYIGTVARHRSRKPRR